MVRTKILLGTALATLALVMATSGARANEGTVELLNLETQDARCIATSVLMSNRDYEILISCRDLIYPGGSEVFTYIVWVTPLDGTGPENLGELAFGKAMFDTEAPFHEMYVTREEQKRVKTPSDDLVMRGNISPFEFLERVRNPTPTPIVIMEGEEAEAGPSTSGKLGKAAVLIFISLFMVGLLVFILIKYREKV